MALFPAIAAKTFRSLGHLKNYKKIYKSVSKKLIKLDDPVTRANYAHKQVEIFNKKVFSDPVVAKNIQCKKGCSLCCHTQVSITNDESILLADLVTNGVRIDWQKLNKQIQAGSSHDGWYKLSFDDRACVFLDSTTQSCSIYEKRPLVCRTNNVVSDPNQCDTRFNATPTINLINTFESDIVTYAAFEKSSGGVLPSLLWKVLERIGKVPMIFMKTKESKASVSSPF